MREVPHRTCSCNNKLGASNDKGIHPEKTEQMINKYIPSLLSPFHGSHKLERSVSGLDISHREDIYSCENPECNKCPNNSQEDYWDEEDRGSSVDEVSSAFYD